MDILKSDKNLGRAAIKLGPLYLDTDTKGHFFLALDFGCLGGVKIWFDAKGYVVEGAIERKGSWE